MTEINEREIYAHSTLIRASYGSREMFGQWLSAAFGFMVFFYYEVVVGLDVILAAIAYVLYSIWNAINDPLLGYLCEKAHMPWEKKMGIKAISLVSSCSISMVTCLFACFYGSCSVESKY